MSKAVVTLPAFRKTYNCYTRTTETVNPALIFLQITILLVVIKLVVLLVVNNYCYLKFLNTIGILEFQVTIFTETRVLTPLISDLAN